MKVFDPDVTIFTYTLFFGKTAVLCVIVRLVCWTIDPTTSEDMVDMKFVLAFCFKMLQIVCSLVFDPCFVPDFTVQLG